MSKRLSITIDGHRVPYSVRVSQRAKRARLTINPVDGLVVVLPAGYERSRVPAILKAHAPWVIKHIDRIAAPAAPVIRDGATVLFRGEHTPVKIEHLDERADASTVHYRDGEIHIALHPSHVDAAGDVFEQWIRATARRLVRREIAELDPEGRFPFKRLYIRNQKTKWGSCSDRMNLSLNCRLAMAPPFVLRYIVAHEMAHLKELNHSKRFWELVESLYGDYQEAERWLQDNGALLCWR